jgi:hypothetical protein
VLVLCWPRCGQQPADNLADALAADPVRLQGIARAMRSRPAGHGRGRCRAAAEAFRRRFFSGEAGPDEYQTLADLPPIPTELR